MKLYTFICPVCAKVFRSYQGGEPMCTGPSESRDEHEMVIMHLQSIDQRDIHPMLAERRAAGPLIIT